MQIVFIGPPGAGKSTQAELMIARYHVAHLSSGEMLRQACEAKTVLGLKVQRYMLTGELVPDGIIIEVVQERLEQPDCKKGYLLDGFPRTIAQAEVFDAMLSARKAHLSVVLELHLPDDELFGRLANRGRADDTPEIIRHRLAAFHRQTEPLLGFYRSKGLLKTIDGSGSVEDVFDRARVVLDPLA